MSRLRYTVLYTDQTPTTHLKWVQFIVYRLWLHEQCVCEFFHMNLGEKHNFLLCEKQQCTPVLNTSAELVHHRRNSVFNTDRLAIKRSIQQGIIKDLSYSLSFFFFHACIIYIVHGYCLKIRNWSLISLWK